MKSCFSTALCIPERAFLFIVIFLLSARALPLPDEKEGKAAEFLSKYGYVHYNPESEKEMLSHEELVEAIRSYQTFVGLKETGKLDNDTVHKMSLPRCGVKDREITSDSRRKRFTVHGSRWSKRHLTYSISKYSEKIHHREVDEVIRRAFQTWSEVTPLTFSQRPFGPVDISIQFAVGEHGDGKNSSFDGPGGALAHAFFPAFGGAAHFDDAEDWSLTDDGTNLYSVATHEFGHSLGLHHTDVHEAVMSPYYQYNDFGLHSDDEEGIQSLYGHRHTHFKAGMEPIFLPHFPMLPDMEKCPDLCKDPAIDTVFTSPYGKVYLFKGDYYWQLVNGKLVHWHPRRINDTWFALPGNIDAAFTYSDGTTYFFKGSQYWGYSGGMMEPGYPKNISDELPGIPNDIDAAMVWGLNRKLYFFKGSEFWLYDPNTTSHPKPMSAYWGSVPGNLHAAYTHPDHSTYFIKGNHLYKFDNWEFDVETADPPYPRNMTEFIYECWKTNIFEDSYPKLPK